MNKLKKYYSLATQDAEASIFIYGDIVVPEWACFDSDTSAFGLAKEIEDLDVDVINVYINSYGGHVSEGLAIYNSLKRHKAKVKTYCDGFACSAASVVFMGGDERIMNDASLLMIHNAWNWAAGDANQLRKEADDLETMTQASINAYMAHVNISEDELKELMDKETWLLAQDAFDMGFATTIVKAGEGKNPSQSIKKSLVEMILRRQKEMATEPEQTPEPAPVVPTEPEQESVTEPEPHPEPDENKVQKLMAALFR